MLIELDVESYKRTLQSRLECEADSTVRRNLRVVLEHFDREIAGDIEGVMTTLSEKPTYHLYNVTNALRESLRSEITGSQPVRELYLTAIEEGTLMLQELNPRWLIADANGVGFDASAKLAFSGRALQELGYKTVPSLNYLYEGRLCAFLMINGKGKLTGEDVYFDPTGFDGIVDRPIDRSSGRR